MVTDKETLLKIEDLKSRFSKGLITSHSGIINYFSFMLKHKARLSPADRRVANELIHEGYLTSKGSIL